MAQKKTRSASKVEFRKLQIANDEALLEFWKWVTLVSVCKTELHATRQYLAVREAENNRDKAEVVMASARSAFLKARLAISNSKETGKG